MEPLKGYYTPAQVETALKGAIESVKAMTFPLSATTVTLIVRDYLKAVAKGKYPTA